MSRMRTLPLPMILVVFLILPVPCFDSVETGPVAAETRVIRLGARILEFAPTRDDMTVGVAVLNLFASSELRVNGKEAEAQWQSIELEEASKNRFRLPELKIEFVEGDDDYLCMSLKVWFKEVVNEFDSLYYKDLEDRYALLSYCTGHADGEQDRIVNVRFSQNRVETLEKFQQGLARPFAIELEQHRIPSPGIAVGEDGTVFVFSFFPDVRRPDRHRLWKIDRDGTPQRIPLVAPGTAFWRTTPHSPTVGRGDTVYLSGLLQVSAVGVVSKVPYSAKEPTPSYDAPVAADGKGNLYFGAITQRRGAPRRIQIGRMNPDGKVQVVAGSADGHKDGPAGEARFVEITAIAVAPSGDLYVADGRGDRGSWIRRIDRQGNVSTLAGGDEVGLQDGRGASARFRIVSALAADEDGNVFVADRFNGRIRKVAPDGVVTTVAGGAEAERAKDEDARGRDASFTDPCGVAVGPQGEVYVLDSGRREAWVRRISPGGEIETIAELRSSTPDDD